MTDNTLFQIEDYLDLIPQNIHASNLRKSTKILLGCLINAENEYSRHNDKKGYFHIANSTLAQQSRLGRATVIRELGKMSNPNILNFLNRVSGSAHKQSHYTLNWDAIKSYSDTPNDTPNTSVNQGVTKMIPQNETPNDTSMIPQMIPQMRPIEYRSIELQNTEDRIQNLEYSNIENRTIEYKEKTTDNKLTIEKERNTMSTITITGKNFLLNLDLNDFVNSEDTFNDKLNKIDLILSRFSDNSKTESSNQETIETPSKTIKGFSNYSDSKIEVRESSKVETIPTVEEIKETPIKVEVRENRKLETIPTQMEEKEIVQTPIQTVEESPKENSETPTEAEPSMSVYEQTLINTKNLFEKLPDCKDEKEYFDKLNKLSSWLDKQRSKGIITKADDVFVRECSKLSYENFKKSQESQNKPSETLKTQDPTTTPQAPFEAVREPKNEQIEDVSKVFTESERERIIREENEALDEIFSGVFK